MRNKLIPFQWKVSELKLVNYHRYTSYATDVFIEINNNDENNKDLDSQRAWFRALRERVEAAYMDTAFPEQSIRTRQWDNKVVIECLTSQGNTIFVGFYDWTMCIGLGVRSDSWIKPYPFVDKPIKITHEREGRDRLWTVPKALKGNKTFEEIMMEHGYHPAGYGASFGETEDENNYYFKCSNSCD